MTAHVVILCQGKQTRLPQLAIPKQMLRLPACDNEPILYRTIRQTGTLQPNSTIEVVCWLPLAEEILRVQPFQPGVLCDVRILPDPGNSSLRGIAAYLERSTPDRRPPRKPASSIAVLLGDVVYSWKCLEAVFAMDGFRGSRFTGTSDLTESGGEIWGISWPRHTDWHMREMLEAALLKHPPFEAYQPGQLRRWLKETSPSEPLSEIVKHAWYTAIDDYTRDIDLPEHVDMLGDLSVKAAADDKEHGVTW